MLQDKISNPKKLKKLPPSYEPKKQQGRLYPERNALITERKTDER